MKVTKQIDIYLMQKRNVRVIDVVQYDTGIQLVFNVKDFEIPSGVTATLYVQKPSGKFVYQIDDITVSGLTSLAPNMTILTDTEGVVVECEYNRDTNKVIGNIVKAITALGGSV